MSWTSLGVELGGGLLTVLACVLLARVARGGTLHGVCIILGAWLAVLLILYELGMSW